MVPDDKLRVDPLPRPSGNIKVISANSPNDKASVNIYNPDGSYNLDALAELNHVLRCRRTDDEKDIDPQLLTLLSHVYDHFHRPLEIVSGYRNQRKQTSNHYKGRASDIRITGVSPKKIEAFAETLDRGGMGIGIYPRGGVRPHGRPLAAQLPVGGLLAAEFERSRKAPAPRLEAQEAAVVSRDCRWANPAPSSACRLGRAQLPRSRAGADARSQVSGAS